MISFKSCFVLAGALALSACATDMNKQVDSEADKQPTKAFHGGVASKGLEAIEASKTLTVEQKSKIKELQGRVALETFKTQDEMAKLKGVLFETLATVPYQPEKVDVIKQKLVDLNNKKMKTMFQAIDELEKIVGYTNEKREMYRAFMGTGAF